MGAELHVESAPGEGSRFFFSLPLLPALDEAGATPAKDAGQPALDARLAPGQHATALVVDDSTVSRRILASLLESAGVQVITAAGGIEGIDLARRHHPDVIFMDVKMADLDGFSATRRLKSDEATRHIPVIAVTASAFGDTRLAAEEAGCAAYLPKPVRAEALFASLQAYVGLKFVRGDDDARRRPVRIGGAAGMPELATRLRDAVAIGGISDLQTIADELAGGAGPDAELAQQIARLVTNFDFDGVRELAASLGPEQGRGDGD
jgi:CheY-like chemotaxis protein